MSSNIFYTGTKKSKTGKDIPVLSNGRTFFSEYNPERDIQFYANTPSVKDSGFILVAGIGDGSHINTLLELNPKAVLLILEYNKETLEYLFESKLCSPELKNNPRVSFTTPETLCTDLKNTYIPVLYGTFLYHPVKAWQLAYEESGESSLKDMIQETLRDIAADYATQARFGKLMHTNILKNLELFSEAAAIKSPSSKAGTEVNDIILYEEDIRTIVAQNADKKAAIIGAGPSLDESMPLLEQNRNRFFIISTDTAYRSLYRNGIKADMVVTLDGQNASISHFIGIDSPETIVAADICTNAAAARHLMEKGHKLYFFTTGHPLGTLVNSWYKNACISQHETSRTLLPVYTAGSGTVLSAAADIAVKAGFRSIRFFGADFAYKSGKPYTRGTYLDDTFLSGCNRIVPEETSFCALCYRTELTKTDEGYTTPLLSSYKNELISYIASHNALFSFVKSGSNLPESKAKSFEKQASQLSVQKKSRPLFDYGKFISFFLDGLKNNDKSLLFSILPYATWINEKEKNADIEDIFAKAVEITAFRRS
ncbi:MAG: motility associated factor glycosyltransferase family protein [Spirochaetaceae bacterium]|nr:motility associated factor glycosyltransferase family protein [Spirochaetaceae bacterium]